MISALISHKSRFRRTGFYASFSREKPFGYLLNQRTHLRIGGGFLYPYQRKRMADHFSICIRRWRASIRSAVSARIFAHSAAVRRPWTLHTR